MKVKVTMFDRLRGEGLVSGLNDEGVFTIYACNIPGKKTWFPETACVYYEERTIVDVRVDDEGFVIGITNGVFDEAKWNSLDHDRLAFKCDEGGKAINGLFADKRKKAG